MHKGQSTSPGTSYFGLCYKCMDSHSNYLGTSVVRRGLPFVVVTPEDLKPNHLQMKVEIPKLAHFPQLLKENSEWWSC